jgi:hypothetical protein
MQKVLVAAALLGILLGIIGFLVGAGTALHDLGRAVGHVDPLWVDHFVSQRAAHHPFE